MIREMQYILKTYKQSNTNFESLFLPIQVIALNK